MEKQKNYRGGKRHGAGRPKSGNPPRIIHALKFTDKEWENIKIMAGKEGKSARAYLSSLVDAELQRKKGGDSWN